MTELEISNGNMLVHVSGIDKFLSFKSELEIPLEHVSGAVVGIDPEARDELKKSWRVPGAYVPGITVAGSYVHHGKWMFWNIHRGKNAITVWLNREHYNALVFEVENPEAAVAQIMSTITPS